MKRILPYLTLLFFIPAFSQYKNQSIGFKENKGQIIDQKGKPNNAVKYLLNSNGLNVQLRKNGFSYEVYEIKKTPIKCLRTAKPLLYNIPQKDKTEQPDYSLEYIFHRIDIDFVNSNSKVELITDQESKDFDNYYNVPNKPEGIINVHQYKQITYKNIYPNIDVVFTIPEDPKKTVEYNFVVHPKGKISDIQLKFKGTETDLVDNKIKMNVRFGEMEETLPASWTEDGTSKKEITVGYRKIKNNVYGFETSSQVSDKTLIIDPVPVRLWGTFYGDEQNNGNITFGSIATDLLGNNYLTGFTSASNSSYATSGAHQVTIGNPNQMAFDGIIVKFSSTGNRIWSTYYGGAQSDKINGIKTDAQNNVIIVGETHSKTNISTINSYNASYGGYVNDAFLAKFNDSGVRLWGAYYGGSYDDAGYEIDIDNNNNIFIVGTYSINRSENIHNTPIGDGFIAKYNPNGNVLWDKLYGGKNTDGFRAIKVGGNFIMVGGFSNSVDNISTSGVFQENFDNTNSGANDGIVLKLNLDGNRIWSTYYGGESEEKIQAIEIDDDDNVYIGGKTRSSTNIATSNSFDDYNLNSDTGFFAKLNKNGQRIWGTYLGSSTEVHSFVFTNNSLYVGGNGGIDNSITSLCAYKRTGYSGGYVGKFSKAGEFIWGSYTGGFNQYSKTKITIKNDEIVIGGMSSINDGISDQNSYQTDILGSNNFYLMKFSEENNCNIDADPTSNTPVCIGNKLIFKANSGYNYSWTGPNNFSSNLQNPSIDNVTVTNNGLYTLVASDNCGCEKKYELKVIIGDIQPPVPNLLTLPTISGDCNTTISTIPTATDTCAGAITGTTANPLSYTLPGTYTIVWNYDDGNGNSVTQNQTVIITAQPLPTVTSPQTFCALKSETLDNVTITGQNIKWYDKLTGGALLPNTTLLVEGKAYYASQTISGCESERIAVNTKIQDTPKPTGNVNQPFCSSQNPTLQNIVITGENIKWYDNLINGNLLSSTSNLQNGITYYASQTVNSCEGERLAVTISIQNTPSIPTGDTNPKFCKSEKATLNSIVINEPHLKWFSSNTTTTALANTTLVVNKTTYYVSQTIGCESERLAVLVNVNDTPLPTASTKQTFCIDENATISDIIVSGNTLKWYDALAAGNTLISTATLENKTYYATQTNTNCESERLAIVIKIQDTQAPTGDLNQNFCMQQNATINKIKISGQGIKWYNAITAGEILSESTPLENGIIYYASQTIANCESDRTPITIQIQEATTADCINYVDELPYPKFFTPNSDGYNDTWTIDFAYLAPNSAIRIFDRYGKLIKILNLDQDWDGTYNAHNLPSSDYWFVVTRLNGVEFRSHFALKR